MPNQYELAARVEEMPSLSSFVFWTIAFVVICGVIYYLQKQLSVQEDNRIGLILPAISVLVSLVLVVRAVIFSAPITAQVESFYEMVRENAMGLLGLAVVLLVITNIPTVLLMLIYRVEKRKLRGEEDDD